MKFGVITFPGSNCDDDLYDVLKNTMNCTTVKLWHKETDLQGCDFIFLPGGFSYGDYLRSGAIARFSPIMDAVIKHAERGGYVMGICNGFQILTEAQLLPGALLRNVGMKFICKNTYITPVNTDTVITSCLQKNKAYKIPVAHAEGRFYASEATLDEMKSNGQILFKYCHPDGTIDDTANINGSIENIAGICNTSKNVFGMMPHPERAASEYLSNTEGKAIFESILKNVRA
ncbi:MAG: phosphoribosylformylglycinamidine synthase subunit PurQ [Cytophagaceae bacterium]|nr:phosphoribosylformylglycinamidine synthase subunit PurQ [Cytophagaceae bacterium]MDW8456751.1 phosphoribosylformylglycinamidine synthase subunit PurQ [Cytophagaceae bacterium]